MKVFVNGEFVDKKDAKISVFDHGFLYGDGIFETLQVDNLNILNFEKHIQRLKNSAQHIVLNIPNIDFEQIIRELLRKNKLENTKARVRITVTRGENNFDFLSCKSPSVVISAVQLQEKPKQFLEGTNCCSLEIERPLPQIKTIQLLANTLAQQKMNTLNCDECFLINHKGEITEGSVSNFFTVKDGIIFTAPLKDCLEGTMRQSIFEICKKAEIEIIETEIYYRDLQDFDEAFWTNALVQIAPIKQLDEIDFEQTTMAKFLRTKL